MQTELVRKLHSCCQVGNSITLPQCYVNRCNLHTVYKPTQLQTRTVCVRLLCVGALWLQP
jgi:hypothetical protein